MPHIPHYIATVSTPTASYRLFAIGNYNYQIVEYVAGEALSFLDLPDHCFERACAALAELGPITSTRYN